MFTWNSAELCHPAVLPQKAGEALKIATFTQLKVLLYIATCGQSSVDAAACAAALGGRVTEADCADALAFWEKEGVLLSDGTPEKPKKAAAVVEEAPQPPLAPAAPSVPKSAPVVKTLTPADTPKPKKKTNYKEFTNLLHTVEARFGKTLSRSDQDRLLDLCEQTALPMEVLIMIVAYAVKNDKKSVRYIKTTAENWEEQGINTIDAADRHLCHLERREKAWTKLTEWLSLEIERPTVSQKDLAEKWIFEFKQKQPLIALAYAKCVEKTGKFHAVYMDRLLISWHEDGITTPDKAEHPQKSASKKTATSAQKSDGGFDVDKYEQLIAGRTPRFRKKES